MIPSGSPATVDVGTQHSRGLTSNVGVVHNETDVQWHALGIGVKRPTRNARPVARCRIQTDIGQINGLLGDTTYQSLVIGILGRKSYGMRRPRTQIRWKRNSIKGNAKAMI